MLATIHLPREATPWRLARKSDPVMEKLLLAFGADPVVVPVSGLASTHPGRIYLFIYISI